MGSPGQNHCFNPKLGVQGQFYTNHRVVLQFCQEWGWMLGIQKQQMPTTGWHYYLYFLDEDTEIL